MAERQKALSRKTIAKSQLFMFVTFSLSSIESEAAEKVASMMEYSDRSEQDLIQLCEARLASADVEAVQKALSFAASLKSTSPGHPSMRAYLSHPIRVARISLQLQTVPSVATVILGLFHNAFEVAGIVEQDLLSAGYDEQLVKGIRLLTIDREHQYDVDYLASYYGDIENFGEELVLIKSVDRLDNLLAFRLIERTPRIARYLELSDRFVTPMSERLSPELGKYHHDVIQFMQRVGCDPSLKASYAAFTADSKNG